VTILNAISPPEALAGWDDFVAAHPSGHLLQTTGWGRLKAEVGWDWEVVLSGTPEAPQAGALVLYRSLPLKLGTVAYVPRGPVVAWEDETTVKALLMALHRAAQRRRAWACWVEPELPDGHASTAVLLALRYRPPVRSVQPRRTILVDLTPTEDEILAAMKSKTRYNVRLSQRRGIRVRQGTLEDIPLFYRLMQETGVRDAFGIHTEAYYRRAYELFAPRGQVALLLAELEGEPLAGVLAFAVGTKAWYIAGGSSNRHRNLMPTYGVQWAAMQWARARGCTVYDLWGVPDADEEILEREFTERRDGLWGVYRFKRGFGGRLVRYVGLWERSLHPLYPLASALALKLARR